MRHVFHVRKYPGRRVVHRVPRLPSKRVISQIPAVDECPAIGQHHHAVAEHVPAQRLCGNRPSLRIPHGRTKVGLASVVTRTRNDQHLAVVQKSQVNGIDRHQIRQGRPPPVREYLLGPNRLRTQGRQTQGEQNRCSHRPPVCSSLLSVEHALLLILLALSDSCTSARTRHELELVGIKALQNT